MPRPVLALPCASRSMTRTRRPAAAMARGSASAVAMLTGYLLQANDDPPRIRSALAKRGRHCPVFASKGQFILDPFPFEKQAFAPGAEKRLGEAEQPVEGRAGAGGHDIDRVRRDCLDAARSNRHIDLGDARRFPKKCGFSRIRLDQLDAGRAENRQNETREAGAAPKIDHAPGFSGEEGPELRRIEDVPTPQIAEGMAANEVDPPRPPDQQRGVRLEPGKCF